MNRYFFGNRGGKYLLIKAPDLETAIKVFAVVELFPEQYLPGDMVCSRKYDSVLERYVIEPKPRATIPVYIEVEETFVTKSSVSGITRTETCKVQKKIHDLLLADCSEHHLPPSSILPEKTGDDETTGQITSVVINGQAIIVSGSKAALRNSHDELQRKKHELEVMQRQCRAAVEAIQKDLKKKQELLYAVCTYMGQGEEIVPLLTGQNAPEDTPLSVFQEVLYMDEEMGAWDKDSLDGIDFSRIEEFDAWIARHYETFLYREKSVCVFQIRRYSKDYGDPLENAVLNAENMKSYFLVRNGGNLYRIYGNVHIRERVFPTKDEYESIIAKYRDTNSSWGEKNLNNRHKHYMYGLIYLQGLIERSSIFGNGLKGVSLPKGIFTQAQIELIRDSEQSQWITDGKPSWNDFRKNNQATIGIGSRIVLMPVRFSPKDDLWRLGNTPAAGLPPWSETYLVEAEGDGWGYMAKGSFIIRYNSADTIHDEYEGFRPRKRRVSYRFFPDEVINFDRITVEECDYYIKNRLERKHYRDILPVLYYVRRCKERERALENNFVSFMAGRMSLDERLLPALREVIAWWKLKNKWKRGLMTDDQKAVRMIEKKMQAIAAEGI